MSTLFVVATPIGNLEDMTPRAVRVLQEVRLIAAEDTRHSRRLLTHFGIQTPLVSYHEHNQRERRDYLLAALDAGDVALITDAGTPAISDPGADLVSAALAAGHVVSPVAGPSALSAAVSASGLIDGPFMALGFLPRERQERATLVARGAASGLPLVLFESARRLPGTLRELEVALGDRRAVVLRELTKVHEEVRAGFLSDLANWSAREPPRGEIVVVVEGAAAETATASDAAEVIHALRRSGLSPSRAAREAAVMTGIPRSELYRMATRFDPEASVGLEGKLPLADEDALQEPLRDQKRPKRRKA